MNDVALPVNAKKPKNSFFLDSGTILDNKDLLVDWFGPTIRPSKIAEIQKIVLGEFVNGEINASNVEKINT